MLSKQLEDHDNKLQALQQQHGRLRNASADTIQGLQQTLQDLEKSCAELQV